MASLGSLVVSLAMDTARFNSDIGKVGQSMARLTASAAKIGAGLAGAAVTAGGALAILVKQQINAADAASKTAQKVGLTTEAFTELSYAAELSGLESEAMSGALKKLAKNAADAAIGTGDAKDAFTAMGINVKDSNGQLKNTDVLMKELAAKFATYQDGAQKSALAMRIFGKTGADLIPLLNGGAAGLEKMAAEARRLGIVIDGETGRAAEAFNDNLTRLGKVKQGLITKITADLMPALKALSDDFVANALAVVDMKREYDSLRQESPVVEFARKSAMAVAILADALVGVAKLARSVGGSFQAVAADAIFLGKVAAAANPVTGGLAFKSNRDAIAVALEERNKVVAEANQRYIDLWNYDGARFANAVERAFSAEQRAFNKFQTDPRELARRGRPVASLGMTAAPEAPAVKAAKAAKDKISDYAKELQRLYDTTESMLKTLRLEVDTQGASDRVRELIKMTREGVEPEQIQEWIRLRDAQDAYTASVEKQRAAEEERRGIMAEGRALFESTRTPMERLAQEQTRLNDLLQAGAISWDVYSRAVFAAQDKYDTAIAGVAKVEDELDKFVERARQNIQDSIGQGLADAMEGNFKDIGNSFLKMVNRMIAEAAAANITKHLLGETQDSGGLFGGWLKDFGKALGIGRSASAPSPKGSGTFGTGDQGNGVFTLSGVFGDSSKQVGALGEETSLAADALSKFVGAGADPASAAFGVLSMASGGAQSSMMTLAMSAQSASQALLSVAASGGGGGGAVASAVGGGGGFMDWIGDAFIGMFGLKKGGYAGDGDPNQPAGVFHGKEYVLNARAVAALGVASLDRLQAAAAGGAFGLSRLFGGRAGGGPVSPHTPYMVGERGPERFVPTTAGAVESSRQSRPIVMNFAISGPADRRTQEQLAAAAYRGVTRAATRRSS